MTLRELILLFRREADDATEPYLWDDEEVTEFANDAESEAARRGRLLVDSTSSMTTLAVAAADGGLVLLDPRIVFVRHARITGRRPLARLTTQDLDEMNPWWRDAAPGPARCYVTDYQSGALLLWPAPSEDATLRLTVVRTPLAALTDQQDSPEIAPRWHAALRHWMLFRAYGKQDSQANDPKKQAACLTLFEQEFGKQSAAIDETWIAREQTVGDGTF